MVMLFNGTNNDPTSKAIYARWLEKHAGTDHISGSPSPTCALRWLRIFVTTLPAFSPCAGEWCETSNGRRGGHFLHAAWRGGPGRCTTRKPGGVAGFSVHVRGYDEQAIPELDSEALDFRAASELFAPVRKLRRADLETLRLVTKHMS